ncbi:hypothetical protein PSCICF_00100 [Pseudomonas cichorii]|nr:hypothetical protein PSCICF_00100 [Pseudomonas cichorii]GFM59119.1 hypothetical protein PSCICG_02790 [Pseudomonas cichorii]
MRSGFGPGKPGFPRSGIAPWVRTDGPSLARRRLLGVLPRNPLHNASTRPSPTSQSALSGLFVFKKKSRAKQQQFFNAIVQTP